MEISKRKMHRGDCFIIGCVKGVTSCDSHSGGPGVRGVLVGSCVVIYRC